MKKIVNNIDQISDDEMVKLNSKLAGESPTPQAIPSCSWLYEFRSLGGDHVRAQKTALQGQEHPANPPSSEDVYRQERLGDHCGALLPRGVQP